MNLNLVCTFKPHEAKHVVFKKNIEIHPHPKSNTTKLEPPPPVYQTPSFNSSRTHKIQCVQILCTRTSAPPRTAQIHINRHQHVPPLPPSLPHDLPTPPHTPICRHYRRKGEEIDNRRRNVGWGGMECTNSSQGQ